MKLFSKKFFVILAFSAGFGSYVLAPFKEEPTNRDTEETTNQRDREKQRALAIEKQERAQKEQKRIQDLQTNERLKNANKELKKARKLRLEASARGWFRYLAPDKLLQVLAESGDNPISLEAFKKQMELKEESIIDKAESAENLAQLIKNPRSFIYNMNICD